MKKNEKPILFSTEMVKANIAGRKTMTRRTRGLETVNDTNPSDWTFVEFISPQDERPFAAFRMLEDTWYKAYPQYNIGDIIWVRETFFDTIKYKDHPLFKDETRFLYKAEDAIIGDHKWKPSIFMPKEATRLYLEVMDIRVERLQNITDEDAEKEGIDVSIDYETKEKHFLYYPPKNKKKAVYIGPCEISGTYISKDGAFYNDRPAYYSFSSLWQSINGDKSWDYNPWVFVYIYKIYKTDELPF